MTTATVATAVATRTAAVSGNPSKVSASHAKAGRGAGRTEKAGRGPGNFQRDGARHDDGIRRDGQHDNGDRSHGYRREGTWSGGKNDAIRRRCTKGVNPVRYVVCRASGSQKQGQRTHMRPSCLPQRPGLLQGCCLWGSGEGRRHRKRFKERGIGQSTDEGVSQRLEAGGGRHDSRREEAAEVTRARRAGGTKVAIWRSALSLEEKAPQRLEAGGGKEGFSLWSV